MIDNFVALIILAWYIFTGYLFAELMRQAAKQHSGAIWTVSYAAIVFGWIAIIPPTVFANAKKGASNMTQSVYNKVRYGEFRSTLQELNVGKWFTYHRGNLAVARKHNREIELIGRLTWGLGHSGAVILMQKRDEQGVMDYMLYPTRKLKIDDFKEAAALNPPLSKEAREYLEQEA